MVDMACILSESLVWYLLTLHDIYETRLPLLEPGTNDKEGKRERDILLFWPWDGHCHHRLGQSLACLYGKNFCLYLTLETVYRTGQTELLLVKWNRSPGKKWCGVSPSHLPAVDVCCTHDQRFARHLNICDGHLHHKA